MFGKILVATDFSENSRAALFAGITTGARCLAHIELVHVISYLEDIYRASRFVVPDANWQKEILDRMEEFFPKHLYPNSDRHVLVGNSVSREILERARKEKCDLIIVGTHGRSALTGLMMGSVAQQLARSSDIPVMIVHDDKHSRPYQSFRRVLVPTDFSPVSEKALFFGSRFAQFLGAELHLVHVIDQQEIKNMIANYPNSGLEVPGACELNVDEALKKMLPEKFSENGKIATLVGDPTEAVLRYSEEQAIDFVVLGTHGRKGLHRVLLGSVTASVASKSRVPVVTLSF